MVTGYEIKIIQSKNRKNKNSYEKGQIYGIEEGKHTWQEILEVWFVH